MAELQEPNRHVNCFFVLVPPAREDVVERSKDTVLRGQQAVIECEGLNLSPDAEVTWTKREGTMPKQHRIEGKSDTVYSIRPCYDVDYFLRNKIDHRQRG